MTGAPGVRADEARAHGPGTAIAGSIVLLVLRVMLGGAFCFAAYQKIHPPFGPQDFAESIQAFKIIHSDSQVLAATHIMPWVEMVAGAALILGIWSREAASIIGMLLVVFIIAIISVLQRGLNVSCGCFGNFHLICPSKIAWCKVWENSLLTLMAATLVVAGGGRFALTPRRRAT